MKPDHLRRLYTKINSKWIEDLNVRFKTIKLLDENLGSKISDTSCSNAFSDIPPQERETEETINTRDYITLKSYCTAKEAIKKYEKTTH